MIHRFEIDIKQYERICSIKRGGFGDVIKVKNKTNSKEYAAKIIYFNSKNEDETLIFREIEIMMRCQHPTIIKMIGFSRTDLLNEKNITIIMDLAVNGSLLNIFNNIQNGMGPSDYTNTTRQIILIGIACGMKYLHDHSIIHRDIKPDNILLDEQLHPLICDFGFSKIFEYGHSNSQSRNGGTLAYMAPEVIRGGNIYDRKADVYSFAILMYELVSDQKAYPNLESKKISPFNFQKKICNNYRPIFNFPIKESIQNLIKECWSDDPNDRPSFKVIFNKLKEKDFFLDDDVDENDVLTYVEDISKAVDSIDELNQRVEDLENEQQDMQNIMLDKTRKWSNEKEKLEEEINEQKIVG